MQSNADPLGANPSRFRLNNVGNYLRTVQLKSTLGNFPIDVESFKATRQASWSFTQQQAAWLIDNDDWVALARANARLLIDTVSVYLEGATIRTNCTAGSNAKLYR